jgi:hypothetical protein
LQKSAGGVENIALIHKQVERKVGRKYFSFLEPIDFQSADLDNRVYQMIEKITKDLNTKAKTKERYASCKYFLFLVLIFLIVLVVSLAILTNSYIYFDLLMRIKDYDFSGGSAFGLYVAAMVLVNI